jgi:hypothetical protein
MGGGLGGARLAGRVAEEEKKKKKTQYALSHKWLINR